MCTTSSEHLLIKTLIVVNLLASPKLCTLAVKIPPEPLQKKLGPLASSHIATATVARTVIETTTATIHGWRLWGLYPGIPGSTESAMMMLDGEEEEDKGSGSRETAGC